MPKVRQTNRMMKVGNQWLPAFLNSVNGFFILYLFKNNKIFISYVFKRESWL